MLVPLEAALERNCAEEAEERGAHGKEPVSADSGLVGEICGPLPGFNKACQRNLAGLFFSEQRRKGRSAGR